jgi:hypothetical protein
LILAAVALPGTGETVKARGTIKFTAYLLGFVGAALLWIHWLGESVSDFLPTAQIGGDIVTARLAALEGMPLRT